MLFRDVPTFFKTGLYLLFSKIPYFPIVASFDVTNKCTLHCKHCYWLEEERENELDDEIFYKKVCEIKEVHPTLISAVWMGGEPLLRKKLVERCKSLFSINEVITNGTIPLPEWKYMRFAVSVDGTKKYHELQRGRNTYDRIKKNIDRSDLNINIICVVTKINQKCLEQFIEEWRQTNIKSVGFAFCTPVKGKDYTDIWLNFKERDKVIERLIKLKNKYPEFINTSLKVLDNFKSDGCIEITNKCRRDYAAFNSMCFDSTLRRKFPCVIGKDAICEKCGCAASVFGETIKQGDKSFIIEHLKTKFSFLK